MFRFTRNSAFLEVKGKRYVYRRDREANSDDSDYDSPSIQEDDQNNDMPLIDFGDGIAGSYTIIFFMHEKFFHSK